MTNENKKRFTVITNTDIDVIKEPKHTAKEPELKAKEPELKAKEPDFNPKENYHSNPMYEKLLQFRNLQEQQKKKFSVDDLFKLC